VAGTPLTPFTSAWTKPKSRRPPCLQARLGASNTPSCFPTVPFTPRPGHHDIKHTISPEKAGPSPFNRPWVFAPQHSLLSSSSILYGCQQLCVRIYRQCPRTTPRRRSRADSMLPMFQCLACCGLKTGAFPPPMQFLSAVVIPSPESTFCYVEGVVRTASTSPMS